MRPSILILSASFAILATQNPAALAQSSPVCATTSNGVTICVRFENRSTAPILNFDFTRDLSTDPDMPTITLIRGGDGSGTYEWRIWATDDQLGEDPADMRLFAEGAYNYHVTIQNPTTAGPGADNLGTCNLTPDSGFYSRLQPGSRLAGNLAGDLTLKSSSTVDGTLSLTIDGNVDDSSVVTAPDVTKLHVGGDFGGKLHAAPGDPPTGTRLVDGPGGNTPLYIQGDVAALYAAHLSPVLRPILLEQIATLLEQTPDELRAAFWTQVSERLSD